MYRKHGPCFSEFRAPGNSPLLRLALWSIGCADVRSGILPPQSEPRYLPMRSSPDPEVVAELPVIDVVAAAPATPRVRRHFVLHVAGFGQPPFASFLHVPGGIVIGQRWRTLGEWRARLERQLVMGDVRRTEHDRAFDIRQRALQWLVRQRVHQVEVDVVTAGVLCELYRCLGLGSRMDAAERAQLLVIETLHAERDPVDASL